MKTGTWIAGIGAATLAVTGAVVVVGGTTAANATDTQVTSELRLITSSVAGVADRLEYDSDLESTANTVLTQSLGSASGGCNLVQGAVVPSGSGSTTLSTFTASGVRNGFVGYKSDSIGVGNKSQASTGQDCAEVVSGENLTWTVPSTLTTVLGAAVPIRASLDVELKQNAVAEARILTAGSTTPLLFTLYSGSASIPDASQDAFNQNCKPDASSGPNSGAADNCDWIIDPGAPFTSIVFTVRSGKFSIEGGGDHGASLEDAHRSVITLASDYTGELPCNSQITATDSTAFSGDFSEVDIERGANGEGSAEDCVNLKYSLSLDNGEAEFLKNDAADPTAQFWPVFTRELDAGTPMSSITNVQVKWGNASTFLWQDLPMCTTTAFGFSPWSTKVAATETALSYWSYTERVPRPTVDYSVLKAPSSFDMEPTALPETQYACTFGRSVETLADGTIVVRDFGYFTGDIKFKTA